MTKRGALKSICVVTSSFCRMPRRRLNPARAAGAGRGHRSRRWRSPQCLPLPCSLWRPAVPAGRLGPVTTDPFALAAEAAAFIAAETGVAGHDAGPVPGSGWGWAAGLIGAADPSAPAARIPGFAAPAVEGHTGTVSSVLTPDGKRALVLGARTHYYEGKGVRAVVHGVRTAAAAGCRTLVLTNGCGGLNPAWAPGTPVLVSDHINLTAASPLEGPTFVDLTDLYSARLRAVAREVDPSLDDGVYVQFRGPHYETPAEVRMAKILGGDLVGMSTTLDAIAARPAGME